MYRYTRRDGRTQRVDRYSRGRWRRRWPQSRAGRFLLWLLILVVLLIVLDQLFGGFQKGTKVHSLGGAGGTATVATPWMSQPRALDTMGVTFTGL